MPRVASFATIIFALVAILLSGHSSDAASVEIDSSGESSSRTLHEVIKSQRRFVLYNSRQLSGECLDICVPDVRTDPPVQTQTREPTKAPSAGPSMSPSSSPSSSPNKSPSSSPSSSPTKSPSSSPSSSPNKSPSSSPSSSPTSKPSASPTKSPSTSPSSSPTSKPSASPTKSPSLSPSASPTKSIPMTPPVCEHKKVINVCIAIDDSGSVCSVGDPTVCTNKCHQNKCQAGGTDLERSGSCCGNYETVQNFATSYVGALDAHGTVSVVKFSNDANTIANKADGDDAIHAINTKNYYGGYTNTEQAIHKCTEMIKDLANPVIVVVTDGTPTACKKKNSGNTIRHGNGDCNKDSCPCEYGDNTKLAAYDRADYAAENGVTVVPVVIQSVSTKKDVLQKLARCPVGDLNCDTDKFMDLHVNEIGKMGEILGNLIEETGCEDDPKAPTAGPSMAPSSSPSSSPTKSPSTSPSTSPSKSPTISPTGTICTHTKAIDVCVAIDNSGSVCSVGSPRTCTNDCEESECQEGGFLGENSCCGNYQTVTKFATDYIDAIDAEGTVSVVTFASSTDVLADSATAATAISSIKEKKYSGGYTATDYAIWKCTDLIKGKPNPVIVLVTDGTPTACKKEGSGSGFINTGDEGCDKDLCGCKRGDNPEDAAQKSADRAAKKGVIVVPVVVNSVSTNREMLQSLARCPNNSCNVEDFKELHVNKIEQMDDILESLIEMTGCEE